MMQENKDKKILHSPDKLLSGFTRSKFPSYLLIAVAIHIFVFTVASLSYIRDQIDPDGAERRAASTAVMDADKTAKPEPITTEEVVAAQPSAQPVKPVETQPPQDDPNTNSLIMKQITELPEPGEIPDVPNALGISIQDTQ